MMGSRRAILYVTAIAGHLLFLSGLSAAAWRLSATSGGVLASWADALGSVLSPWLFLAVAGIVVWVASWTVVNREARPLTMAGANARAAEPRKAALALGQLAAVLAAAALGWRALRLLAFYFRGDQTSVQGWPLGVVGLATGAVLYLATWSYYEYEASRDEDIGAERTAAARWRRGYVYATIFTGSVLTVAGAGELLRVGIGVGLRPLSGDTSWHGPAAGALAALLIGVLLGALAWGRANRCMAKAPAVEANAPSRVLMRQAGVLFGTVVTLTSLGYLIEQVLFRVVSRGVDAGQHALFNLFDSTWALAYLPVAAIVWINAGRGVRRDAAAGGETRRTGTARRFVRYAVAALALAAFWYGLIEFARLILQVLLGAGAAPDADTASWLRRFAAAAALLLVGAPAWWGHWWSQQVRARTGGSRGRSERASIIRRAYLIGIILVGGSLVVAAAGFGVFLAVNWQAAGALGGVRATVAGAMAAALVSLFWVLTHGAALRGDLRLLAAEPAPDVHRPVPAVVAAPVVENQTVVARGDSGAGEMMMGETRRYSREELAALAAVPQAGEEHTAVQHAVIIVDGGDGGMGVALIEALCRDVPGVRLRPIGTNAAAEAAMVAALGNGTRANTQDQVSVILMPSDTFAEGEASTRVMAQLEPDLSFGRVQVLLLPPRNNRFRWVAAPDWPRERWVENALVEVANLLRGPAD